ncbi:DUF6660 family protein [Flavobacterium sp. '19STA2R22 D10 B1']|uniref:DUF6660 family protein n=1 Tax=Flavobacterium aerium TaxID=3037261 RepID=UPI00278BC25D|nr:DUF6660 family protein [Flavobacterium sp. '19STA2R22 D10 B1']
MKWYLIFLSVYILSLACIPCADAHGIEISTTEQSSIKKHDIEQHMDVDSCSPFCICNCCGSPIFNSIQFFTFDLKESNAVITKKLSDYQFVFSSNFYASIWQPPQL